MQNTWFGLVATLAAAVLLTPAAWAQHHGGHGGHGGYAGHGDGGPAYSGHGYYGHEGHGHEGGEHHGDRDRGWARGWGYPGYYGNGWGAYPGYYSGYYSYSGGYPGYYDSTPDYYSYAPPADSYQYFYPPDSSAGGYDPAVTPAAPSTANEAVVHVRVPDPNAKVWFQGRLTQQTGTDRTYESPQLQPDQSYTYDVRAQWNDDGRMVDQTRRVQVHAGDRVTVDFTAPAANETR